MRDFTLPTANALSATIIIFVLALILPEANLHLLFGLLLCVAITQLWRQKIFLAAMSPANILFFYVATNMLIGGWAHLNGYLLSERQSIAFSEWPNYRVSVSYYILSLSIIYLIDSYYRGKYIKRIRLVRQWKKRLPISYPIVHTLIALPFFFFHSKLRGSVVTGI